MSETRLSTVPPIVHDGLRSPAQSLDPSARSFLESRFGRDFSAVRVHAGVGAARSAQALKAMAYTVGRDVVFGPGHYAPGTLAGRRLLAHELTHVVQQGHAARIQRQPDESPSEPPAPTMTDVEDSAQTDTSTVQPEGNIEPLEASYVSKDVSPDETSTPRTEDETSTPRAELVAKFAGPVVSPLPDLMIPPDHPSEREADAISEAVMSAAPDRIVAAAQRISRATTGAVQFKTFWDSHPTLNWGDFMGTPDPGSPFDASTSSGFSESTAVKTEVFPDDPLSPTPCSIGRRKATRSRAVVSLDISKANLHAKAFMEETQSWVKPGKATAALLAHEQGHFAISHVIAGKTDFALEWWGIQKNHVFEGTGCGDRAATNDATKKWNAINPSKQLTDIINKGLAVQAQAQKDYDDQTKHGAVAAQQAAWLGNIVADLPGYDVL
jgi:hypothetical protein